jgi:hypothetical protein
LNHKDIPKYLTNSLYLLNVPNAFLCFNSLLSDYYTPQFYDFISLSLNYGLNMTTAFGGVYFLYHFILRDRKNITYKNYL